MRLFVQVRPSADAVDHLRAHLRGVRTSNPDQWHVTLAFLGEVDDVFILVMALQRLVANAGRSVLMTHWTGAPADLAELNLREALAAAAFFLPKRIRKRLRVIGR